MERLEHHFPGVKAFWVASQLPGGLGSVHLSVVPREISGAGAADIRLQRVLCQRQLCDLGQRISF